MSPKQAPSALQQSGLPPGWRPCAQPRIPKWAARAELPTAPSRPRTECSTSSTKATPMPFADPSPSQTCCNHEVASLMLTQIWIRGKSLCFSVHGIARQTTLGRRATSAGQLRNPGSRFAGSSNASRQALRSAPPPRWSHSKFAHLSSTLLLLTKTQTLAQ